MGELATIASIASLVLSTVVIFLIAGMSLRLKTETVKQVKEEILKCESQLNETHRAVARLEKQLAIQTGVSTELVDIMRAKHISLPPHVAAVVDILGFKRHMVTIQDVIGSELTGAEIRGLLSWIGGRETESQDKEENIADLMNVIADNPDALEKLKSAITFISGGSVGGIWGAALEKHRT